MSIIIFILILGALIFVHELGHFLAAKKNGIRVDEFAIGFPPRIFSKKVGQTVYSLNSIPFGGYVKIFGENPDEESLDRNAKDSFVNKSKIIQAIVLIAGVTFNIIFAWFLFLAILTSGMTVDLDQKQDYNPKYLNDSGIYINYLLENSPAQNSSLAVMDRIISISNQENVLNNDLSAEKIQEFIRSSSGEVTIQVAKQNQEIEEIKITPVKANSILVDDESTEAEPIGEELIIGLGMANLAEYKLPIHVAVFESLEMTLRSIRDVAIGLKDLITGQVDFSQVSGPVGIVGLIGNAAQFGIINLLSLTALLSINLAVLNIFPFPALDGGRLLFLAIEAVTRRDLNPKIANIINAAGFIILIGLMIVVTSFDIFKIFQ